MGKSRPRSISISANQIREFVVPSPCETEPYNNITHNNTHNNKFVTGVMIKAQTFNDSDDGDILKLYEQDFFTAEVYA